MSVLEQWQKEVLARIGRKHVPPAECLYCGGAVESSLGPIGTTGGVYVCPCGATEVSVTMREPRDAASHAKAERPRFCPTCCLSDRYPTAASGSKRCPDAWHERERPRVTTFDALANDLTIEGFKS